MRQRGGVLAGLAVVALIVAGAAWLLATGAERATPASVLVAPAAVPEDGAPQALAIDSRGTQPIEALAPQTGAASAAAATSDTADTAMAAALVCRVVAEADGAPLAGVEVTVFHNVVPWQPGRPGSSSARSDPDGVAHFSFPLASNVWLVRALPGPGHALVELRPEKLVEPGRTETLELRATRGATLRGTVVDERADPVPRAEVSAWCTFRWNIESSSESPVPEPHLVVLADIAGRFLLEGVGPRFVVMAGAPGKASVSGYVGELREDDERDDVQLVLGPAGEIRGRVLDPSRQPVANISVQAFSGPPEMGGGVPTSARPLKVVAATGPDGRFVLAPLASRTWRIRVTHWQHGQWTGEREPGGDELEIVFAGGCEVRGLVRGADGAPLAGAKLGLQGASEDVGYGPSGWAAATSGEDGRFAFDGLIPTEQAVLSVSAPGHAVHVVEHLVVSAEARDELQLRLVAELAIAGQVVDEQGLPLAGAVVMSYGDRILDLKRSPNATWERQAGKDGATTGEDGRFRLDQLYDGEFALIVSDPRHEGLSTTVSARAGTEDLLIRLDAAELRGAVLVGTVRDGLSGAPLSDFSVWVMPAGEPAQRAGQQGRGGSFQDALGAFSVQGIPPGDHMISARSTGYATLTDGPWTLEAGERTVELLLFPERSLRLRAVDQDGAPVAMAFLRFEDALGREIQLFPQPAGEGTIGATDRNGEVAAQGLPATPIVVVLKVLRATGFWADRVEHRFSFDLRHEPVGVQEVVLPRDKRRLLVVHLYQQQSPHAASAGQGAQGAQGAHGSQGVKGAPADEPASALTGLDPTDASLQERFAAHYHDGSLAPLAVPATVTLRTQDGAVLESASCVPVGEDAFLLQSALYSGEAIMANLLLVLPSDATALDVAADGCAPEHLALPAGDGNVSRMVVLRPAD
jgi:hypothetical protein